MSTKSFAEQMFGSPQASESGPKHSLQMQRRRDLREAACARQLTEETLFQSSTVIQRQLCQQRWLFGALAGQN